MTDLPTHVDIHEEGPREGFQIEPGPISSADKIRLIEALADTGLRHIQVCSFVNTRLVPGWADAEAVVEGFAAKPGVHYTGLFFNGNGLDRALAFKDKLTINGSISLTASEGFTRKNLNRSPSENIEAMKKYVGRANIRPDSRTPRRLPKAINAMKKTEIGTAYEVRPDAAEVSAAVPAATDTATVRT